jgi:signal transduction histidine kinase
VILYKKHISLKEDIAKLFIAVKRARYGDINVRLQSLNNKQLEKTVNRLFETISDRELMIKEYQTTLSDKNLSLEKILKQEKELRLFKEDFVATLTHDMKVPVVAELNSLNYLLEGRFGELNDKQKEALNLMLASNQELKDLIENMLETYKLSDKELTLNKTNNLFNTILEDVIAEMTPIAEKNSNFINTNLSATKETNAQYDVFQLKRVFKNIIQNAISNSREAEPIQIKTELNDDNITVKVTNKGSGISQEDLDLIFNKYYCGNSKFRKAGTGLGLYISQQIMLAHGGSIKIDSAAPDNTTFAIVLPLN